MRTLMLCLYAGTLLAADSPTFDAASIKVAPPPNGGRIRIGSNGGPGTKDPGLFRCDNCALFDMVGQAWNVKRFQITGLTPDMNSERFIVTARVPEGTTKEQFRLMFQNLLIERFHLALHHETKELPMYDLVVAKNGPKLKPSSPESAEPAQGPPPPMGGKLQMDKDGYPILPRGSNGAMIMMNGKARMANSEETMDQFAEFLGDQLGKPVHNGTGLNGKYDISLTWSFDSSGMRMMGPGPGAPPPPPGGTGPAPSAGDPDESGPTLPIAIQEELGLKLEPKKGPVDIVTIDHFDKIPTEN